MFDITTRNKKNKREEREENEIKWRLKSLFLCCILLNARIFLY